MILDKKLNGILDQGSGDLVIFDESPSDVSFEFGSRCMPLFHFSISTQKTYEASLATVKEFSGVVDKLYKKAMRLRH